MKIQMTLLLRFIKNSVKNKIPDLPYTPIIYSVTGEENKRRKYFLLLPNTLKKSLENLAKILM